MSESNLEPVVQRGSEVPVSPVVSACVLVLADASMALRCLDSIRKAAPPGQVETVVIANGTAPEARRALDDLPDITLVRSRTNLGFGGGNNLAATISRGQFLLFVNDDSVLAEDYVDRLLITARADDAIGAVAGKIVSGNGELQETGSVLWSDGWAEHIGRGWRGEPSPFCYVRDVDYASANGLLVRRAAWEAVGGFDERYFPAYYEDVDFCLALHQLGYRVVYEPRAELNHLESQSTSEAFRGFLLTRNRRKLVEKWRDQLARFADRPPDGDEVALAAAIQRANGSAPRLLVLAPGGILEHGDAWLDQIEELARSGWSMTVLLAPETSDAQLVQLSHEHPELPDLGVDVRHGTLERLADTVGTEFEAALVPAGHRASLVTLFRRDGSPVPVLAVDDGARSDPDEPITESVLRTARRVPSESNRQKVSRYADGVRRGEAGDERRAGPGGAGAGPTGSRPTPEEFGDPVEQARLELDAAKAEAGVTKEFVEALEAELTRTRAALDKTAAALDQTSAALDDTNSALQRTQSALDATNDALDQTQAARDETAEQLAAKVAYINSLPSVRLKAWATELHHRTTR